MTSTRSSRAAKSLAGGIAEWGAIENRSSSQWADPVRAPLQLARAPSSIFHTKIQPTSKFQDDFSALVVRTWGIFPFHITVKSRTSATMSHRSE